jgi:hypothetical protein
LDNTLCQILTKDKFTRVFVTIRWSCHPLKWQIYNLIVKWKLNELENLLSEGPIFYNGTFLFESWWNFVYFWEHDMKKGNRCNYADNNWWTITK